MSLLSVVVEEDLDFLVGRGDLMRMDESSSEVASSSLLSLSLSLFFFDDCVVAAADVLLPSSTFTTVLVNVTLIDF